MRKELDILEAVDEFEERVEEIKQTQNELVDRLDEEYGSYAAVPQRFKDTFDEFEEERIELEGRIKTFSEIAEEYDGSIWEISRVTFGQLGKIQDEVSEKSFDFDAQRGEVADGMPKQGYGRVLTLEESIRKQPPDAPTQRPDGGPGEVPDPAEYPPQLGMWLFEKVNAYNTVGDTDLGNSSLRDRMTELES